MRQIISSFGVFIVVLTSMAFAQAAHAKYSLCNKTSYALRASIGYVDGDSLATRGWWPLNPGQCKLVLTEKISPGRYFVYAEAIDGHIGPKRTWSGDTSLCVANSGFFNQRSQEVCRGEPQNQREFFDVEVTAEAKGIWTTDFVEANNYTIYSAEVAGIQRLLNDVGLPVKHIDGTMGRETRRAIAAYRKNRGLVDGNAIDDELLTSLIDEANTRDTKLGFFYCNKASEQVWSAIAFPASKEVYTSKGWWRLDPGQCVKVFKGKLAHDHYYVYGEMGNGDEDPSQTRVLSDGDKEFCTNDVVFNFKNDGPCGVKDLNTSLFKRIEIGASPAATYEFHQDAFALKKQPPEQVAGETKAPGTQETTPAQ